MDITIYGWSTRAPYGGEDLLVPAESDTDERSGLRAKAMIGLRYVALALLPATVTASSGFAGASKGQAKTNLIYLAVFCTLVVSVVNVYREVQTRRASRSARVLATALNTAGAPLVTLLAKIAAERNENARRADTKTLIGRSLAIAHSECGRSGLNKGAIRAVLYRFRSPDILQRDAIWEGRQGKAPRPDFVASRSQNDRRVVETAKGEDYLLIRDVDKAPPEYFLDYKDREYKSFLMVPVRAGGRSYGFISVDSDQPYSLTKIDVGYVTLMSRLIGAALALLGGEFPDLQDEELAAAEMSVRPRPSHEDGAAEASKGGDTV